jgi:hypothetical protein
MTKGCTCLVAIDQMVCMIAVHVLLIIVSVVISVATSVAILLPVSASVSI